MGRIRFQVLHRALWQKLRLGTGRSHHHAGDQQGTGLFLMHLLQGFSVEVEADTLQINGLTTTHARMSRSNTQEATELDLYTGLYLSTLWGQELKGERLQSIPTQEGLGLTKLNVHRG